MTFEEWWDSPDGWLRCDGARAISRRAFAAGAASRDAEVAGLSREAFYSSNDHKNLIVENAILKKLLQGEGHE